MKSRVVTAVFSLIALVGCGAGHEGVPRPGEFTETAVRFNPDGTQSVTTRLLAAEEQARGKRGSELAQPIASDAQCSGASLWIYDRAYRTGNRVCFIGAGTADLWNYRDWICSPTTCYPGTWQANVRSYWAGSSSGNFSKPVGDVFAFEYFNSWQAVDNAGSVARGADRVTLN